MSYTCIPVTTLCLILCTFTYGEEGQFASMQNLWLFYRYLLLLWNSGVYSLSEILLMKIKACSCSVAHVKWQFLQFFGKCRSPTVKHPCIHNKILWSELSIEACKIANGYLRGRKRKILPTVEFGCLEAILVNTSFQFGLAKCVLTWNVSTNHMFNFQSFIHVHHIPPRLITILCLLK